MKCRWERVRDPELFKVCHNLVGTDLLSSLCPAEICMLCCTLHFGSFAKLNTESWVCGNTNGLLLTSYFMTSITQNGFRINLIFFHCRDSRGTDLSQHVLLCSLSNCTYVLKLKGGKKSVTKMEIIGDSVCTWGPEVMADYSTIGRMC